LPSDPANFNLESYTGKVRALRQRIEDTKGRKFDPIIERLATSAGIDAEFREFNGDALSHPSSIDAPSVCVRYDDLKKAGLAHDLMDQDRTMFDCHKEGRFYITFKYDVSVNECAKFCFSLGY
jgi:hypothetical protein